MSLWNQVRIVSHYILNEMLDIMAHDVLWSFTNEVREVGNYGLIMNKTADCPSAFGSFNRASEHVH